MIVLKNKKVVLITPPRTGSSFLRKALAELGEGVVISSHGEVDLIPAGYRDFDVIVTVRDPIERLFSLYNYIKRLTPSNSYTKPLVSEVNSMTFEQWLLKGKAPFTQPNIDGEFMPKYNTLNVVPEQNKSYIDYTCRKPVRLIPHHEILNVLSKEYGINLTPYIPRIDRNSSGAKNLTFQEFCKKIEKMPECMAKTLLNKYSKEAGFYDTVCYMHKEFNFCSIEPLKDKVS